MADDLEPTSTSQDDDARTAEAVARLSAADPAAGVAPDPARLSAAVSARTGVEPGGGADEAASDETADVVATVTPLRRPWSTRWLQVAAASAAVAVVATGAYAVGASQGGGSDLAGAMTLGAPQSAADGAGNEMATEDLGGQAAEGALRSAEGADYMSMPAYWGRTVFTGQGLTGPAGSHEAWGFDPASVFSAETLERVAGVFGVEGEPRQEWGAWTVGDVDGTGPSVWLHADGTASVSYSDPTRDPWSCLQSMPDEPAAGGGSDSSVGSSEGGDEAAVAPGDLGGIECATVEGDAPTGDAAIGVAKDTLADLGLDPADYTFDTVTDTGNPQQVTVNAELVVAEQRTGVSWSFGLVADGVQYAYGALAPLVSLGDYDTVAVDDAVERLMDPRFGSGYGGVMPFMSRGMAEGAVADPAIATEDVQQPTVPATPQPGSAIAWPVQEVTLTSSRMGLGLTTLPDGATLLVPTYELSDDAGSIWTVIAVADSELDFTG